MKVDRKSKLQFSITLISALFLTVVPNSAVWAHHSLVGEFDTSKTIDVRGTITKLEWTNPHIWLYLDVAMEDGSTKQMECEMGSPNQLIRQGWKKQDLPVGTIIRTQANPAWDDPEHICSTRRITMDDGTPIFSRPANAQ
jgi:hypothetical protein